jgi:hypothetical protein
MTSPLALTDPFTTTWYHGTKSMKFKTWQCPPPAPSPADVEHSALFFTANRAFAEGAGQTICTVQLTPGTKVISPALGGTQGTALRKNLIQSNPIAAHCQWLADDSNWITAWSTGEIMRFAYDARDSKAVLEIAKALASVAANLKRIIATPVSEKVIMDQAVMCLTRGWIEQIVREAGKLGFQAIQGAETDRWGNPAAAPVAQPWLAVMDLSAMSPPNWIDGH